MRWEIRNRVEMLRREIVAEVPAALDGRRSWLVIRAVDAGYSLIEISHRSSLDLDDYPAPEDVLFREEKLFSSFESVLRELELRKVSPESFDVPWKLGFPF